MRTDANGYERMRLDANACDRIGKPDPSETAACILPGRLWAPDGDKSSLQKMSWYNKSSVEKVLRYNKSSMEKVLRYNKSSLEKMEWYTKALENIG